MTATTAEACTFPGCPRPQAAAGLCRGHRAQRQRGDELRPLRAYRAGEALERVTLRVPPSIRDAILTDPEGAREALAIWASLDDGN